MTSLRKQDGFTLLELLIAVTILAIVTSQLFMVFSSQKRTFQANQRVLDVQEDARLVLDLISFDARQAGFMVPRIAGISSVDGGAAGPDRLCISDPSVFKEVRTGTPNVLDSQSDHFKTTTVTSIPADDRLVVSTTDIDGSVAFDNTGPVDFSPGNGLIISIGSHTLCAKIESVNGNTIILDKSYSTAPNDMNPFRSGPGVRPEVRVAPAIIYEVTANDTLSRNGMTLATSVEDLQVEYWVDNQNRNGLIDGAPTGDPATEFPIHNLNSNPGWSIDTSRIRRVRVSVITKTDMQEVNPDGTLKITGVSGRPALANRAAAPAPDGFLRRRFVASIKPQNLM
jgi:prepilin-type N-terminal cleavage/methylation domain-containing protein